MNAAKLFRVQDVSRWHTVNMSRRQSVAEHSFNVAALVSRICREAGLPASMELDLVTRALHHDVHEVDTGDMPSKCKDFHGMDPKDVVIKICDLIDALHFSSEFAVGAHSGSVVGFISDQLSDCLEFAPGYLQDSAHSILREIGWEIRGGRVKRTY